MPQTAILRINPDRTHVEVETPDGTEFGPSEIPKDGLLVCVDDEGDGTDACVAVVGEYAGLPGNTVYRLVPIETMVEDDCELDLDGTGEEEQE